MTLLARRAVGDVSHRINRFVCRTAGHNCLSPSKRLSGWLAFQKIKNRRNNFGRFRQTARSGFTACQITRRRTNPHYTASFKSRDICLCCCVIPHFDIHRWYNHHRLVGRKQGRRRQIARLSSRHFGKNIRTCRGDQHKVSLTRQADMAHFGLIGQGKKILINLVLSQGGHRKRGYEFRTAFGQDRSDIDLPVAQASDHLKNLISSNAARDDQKDIFSC